VDIPSKSNTRVYPKVSELSR